MNKLLLILSFMLLISFIEKPKLITTIEIKKQNNIEHILNNKDTTTILTHETLFL